MSLPTIINQIKEGNRTVGSNPTPSESYHYNDLHRDSNTAVTNESNLKHYQQHSLLIRGGYTAEPAYRWWSAQR